MITCRMDKSVVVYFLIWFHSHENEWVTTTYNYVDEPWKHVEQMKYDTIYAAQTHLSKVPKQAKSYVSAKTVKKNKAMTTIKVRIMVTSRVEGKC